MAHAHSKGGETIEKLREELLLLRSQHEQSRRSLEVLYNVSLACRGRTSVRAIFEATYRELAEVFSFDACYIALCHPGRVDALRCAYMVDEGQAEYIEDNEPGMLTRLLISRRTPLLFRDLLVERAQLGEAPQAFGDDQKRSRSWLGVPLLLGRDAVGVVSIQSYQVGLYSEGDRDLLQRVGDVVAVALENANLYQHQQELSQELAKRVALRTREFAALSAIAAEMVLQQPLPVLLDRALGLTLPLFGVEAGSVRLLDAQRRLLLLVAQRGFPEDYALATASISLDDDRLDEVVREQRAVTIPSGLAHRSQFAIKPPFEALLCVPLRISERVIGVLTLLDAQAHDFDEHQINLAQVIGNQIAIAVENARLFEEREHQIIELRALGRINHAASVAPHLPALMQAVHEALCDCIAIDAFAMAVYDPGRQVITDELSVDSGLEYVSVNQQPLSSDSMLAWVIRNRRILRIKNIAAELDAYPELKSDRLLEHRPQGSCLGVPCFDRNGLVIGAIAILSEQAAIFNERDERFIANVAHQVALHVQNVRLLTQRERQIRELDAISRIGEIVSAVFDPEQMLYGVYETLQRVIPHPIFYIIVCDPGGCDITHRLFIVEGERLSIPTPRPLPGSLTEWILLKRQPLLFYDLLEQQADLAQLGVTLVSFSAGQQARSWAGVPLLAEGEEPLGVLSVQDYLAHRYDQQTIDFLSQVATHLCLGVQKIRLFEERERQLQENRRLFAQAQANAAAAERHAQNLELVHRISSLLSGRLDQQEIFEVAAREVVGLFWADHTGIVMFDEDLLWGTLVAEFPSQEALGLRIPLTNNLLAEDLLATLRPICIVSIETDQRAATSREAFRRLGITSLMVVPLVSRGRAIGSISLDSCGAPRSFTEEEQELLLSVAASIAAAIENARLFAAEQEARRTADTLREVTRVLSSSFDRSEVLQLILRELHNVIPYDTASIMLREGDVLRMVAFSDPIPAENRPLVFSIDRQGAAGRVIAKRQPIVIADTRTAPEWSPGRAGSHTRSWLGVPLIVKGEILGILNINSWVPRRFTPRDADVALAFANQAAVALENARLYQESVTRVEQELEIARRIQSNLFPRMLPKVAGLTLAARCLPARETGGDFYDIVPLGDHHIAIMVGDASGKSIPAAMLMAIARSIARSEARDHHIPELVMSETNRWITLDVPPKTFVALCYATLDLAQYRLAVANAGQLAPLLRHHDGYMEYLEVTGPTLPLGIQSDMPYAALEVPLQPGDLLVLYTDGIVEAKDSTRAMFGFDRFEQLIRVYGDHPPEQLIDRVMAEIALFIGEVPQHDDMTIVVLRVE